METSFGSFQNCKYFHLRGVTHVIFDLDGTLIDTESAMDELWKKILTKRNKNLPENFKLRFCGAPLVYTIKCLIDELNIDTSVDELVCEMGNYEEEVFKRHPVKLMKGVEKLIKHFHKHRIPMAIATSSSKQQMELKCHHHPDIFKLINHIVTCDDVLEGKPNPSIYRLAAQRFPDKPKCSSCLVFEDAKNGLMAAAAAEMQCIFIPEFDVKNDPEILKNATLILKSIENFEPKLFALPAIRKKRASKLI